MRRQDASLKRCFGVNKKVAKCDYEYLKTVTMIQEPHEPVPRLYELLQYLAQPEAAHIWAFLDVKVYSTYILWIYTEYYK